MKRILSFFAMFAILLSAVNSCSKENIESDGTGYEDDDIISSTDSYTLQVAAYNQVLGNITSIDTLGNITSIVIGEVLDSTNPKVYSVGVESLEEAKEFLYREILTLVDSSLIKGYGTDNISVDLGDNGVLEFISASGDDSDGIYATLTIELADLPEMKVINFCSGIYFVDNGIGAQMKSGAVYTNSKDGKDYFCIISTTDGRTGVLVRLYHKQQGISKVTYSNGENSANWYTTIATGHPSSAEWDAIQYAYKNANGYFKTFCKSINFEYTVLTSRVHPVGTTTKQGFSASNSWTEKGGPFNWFTYDYSCSFSGYHIYSNIYHFNEPYTEVSNFDTHWWTNSQKRGYSFRRCSYLDDYKIWVERVYFKRDDDMDDWTMKLL